LRELDFYVEARGTSQQ